MERAASGSDDSAPPPISTRGVAATGAHAAWRIGVRRDCASGRIRMTARDPLLQFSLLSWLRQIGQTSCTRRGRIACVPVAPTVSYKPPRS
jgi:hypothetical protein